MLNNSMNKLHQPNVKYHKPPNCLAYGFTNLSHSLGITMQQARNTKEKSSCTPKNIQMLVNFIHLDNMNMP